MLAKLKKSGNITKKHKKIKKDGAKNNDKLKYLN